MSTCNTLFSPVNVSIITSLTAAPYAKYKNGLPDKSLTLTLILGVL